jgi:hypothetical protein
MTDSSEHQLQHRSRELRYWHERKEDKAGSSPSRRSRHMCEIDGLFPAGIAIGIAAAGGVSM